MPLITVNVVYSVKPRQMIERVLQLKEGCTIEQALIESGLAVQFPDLASVHIGVGVWGKKMAASHVLRDLDRIEVYRLLTVDPKVARRERFVGQGAKQAAGLFAKRRAGAKAGY